MADNPATTSVKLYNPRGGARSFQSVEGGARENRILRSGETFEGDILEADAGDLKDLADAYDAKDQPADAGTDEADRTLEDFPSLDGLNAEQLLEVGDREGYKTLARDASEDGLREAIEAARAQNPAYAESQKKAPKASRAKRS